MRPGDSVVNRAGDVGTIEVVDGGYIGIEWSEPEVAPKWYKIDDLPRGMKILAPPPPPRFIATEYISPGDTMVIDPATGEIRKSLT